MSDPGDATLETLQRQVLALREAVAALAVAQAEGLNALAKLASLLEGQYGGFRHQSEAFARMDAADVNRRAAAAARRSLDVAETLLAAQHPVSDEP